MKQRRHNQNNYEREQLCLLVWQGQVCADAVEQQPCRTLFLSKFANEDEI